MPKEYRTIQEVAGPLMLVKDARSCRPTYAGKGCRECKV